MRLSTGEIELVTAEGLERAFECGLVDVRTPVRSASTPIWTTLGEAAGFEDDVTPSFPSLSPVAIEERVTVPPDGEWQVRRYVDARSFEVGRGRTYAVIFAAALALVLGGVIGKQLTADARAERATAGQVADTALRVASPASMAPPPVAELLPEAAPKPERLTDDQKRRLRELDAAQRLKAKTSKRRWRKTSGTPLTPPRKRAEPLDVHDPLNGAL